MFLSVLCTVGVTTEYLHLTIVQTDSLLFHLVLHLGWFGMSNKIGILTLTFDLGS